MRDRASRPCATSRCWRSPARSCPCCSARRRTPGRASASSSGAAVGQAGGLARPGSPGWRCAGRRTSATWPLYSAFSRSAQFCGDVLDDVLVDHEGHDAVVVAVPVAVGVLGARPGWCPRCETLYGWSRPSSLALRAEGEADVDHVGRLRALVVLVGLDGLELVARAGVRVQLVDLDAVLGLEALDRPRRSCTSRAAGRWSSVRLPPWPPRPDRPSDRQPARAVP